MHWLSLALPTGTRDCGSYVYSLALTDTLQTESVTDIDNAATMILLICLK